MGANAGVASVFGLGYVRSVTAACLAHRGRRVIGDVKPETVALVAAGRSPLVESILRTKKKHFGLLGLSLKVGTDDLQGMPSSAAGQTAHRGRRPSLDLGPVRFAGATGRFQSAVRRPDGPAHRMTGSC